MELPKKLSKENFEDFVDVMEFTTEQLKQSTGQAFKTRAFKDPTTSTIYQQTIAECSGRP